MAAYDVNALVTSVKFRASVPTTQATITADYFLALGDQEMQSYIVPLVVASRSEYMTTSVDQLIAGQSTFRMPTRAVGGKLREIQLLSAQGAYRNVPQVSMDQLDGVDFGFYLDGNMVVLWNRNQPISSEWPYLRLRYYTRPNALVYPTTGASGNIGVVASIADEVVTLTDAVPSGWTSSTLVDVVRWRPGFECLATDQAITPAGSTVTFSAAITDLQAGDYVCLAGQSPVPQIPVELHPLLAQSMAIRILESLSDTEALTNAVKLGMRLESDARDLIAQRVEGEPLRIVNRSSLFRQYF